MSEPIQVYVELAGKEKYHQSLKGKDEPDQHPISAISNLEDRLLSLDEKITINKNNISDLSNTTNERFLCVQTTINDTKTEIINQTDAKIEEVENYIKSELANIDLEGYYTKEETDEKLEGTFHYKGSVPDFESLPYINNQKGDVYNVNKTGANYVWTGCAWDNLSPTICLKGYATKDYVDGTIEASVRLLQNHLQVHYYDKTEIDKKFNELANIDPELLANTFVYRGSVLSVSRLPVVGKVGDTYTISSDNSKVFWNGANWEKLSEDLIDKVYLKTDIDNMLSKKADIVDVYNKNEINDAIIRIEQLISDGDTQLTELINNKATEVTNDLTQKIDELSKLHDTDMLTLTRALGDLGDHLHEEVTRLDTRIDQLTSDNDAQIQQINEKLIQVDNSIQNNTQYIQSIEQDFNEFKTQVQNDITQQWQSIGTP